MDGRPRDRCESVRRQNSAYRPSSRDFARRLVLVLAPHRSGGAGVADGPRLVHGAEGERMVAPAEEAVDLDPRGFAGDDAHHADRTAPDATGPRDRSALVTPLDRVQRHARLSSPSTPASPPSWRDAMRLRAAGASGQ